MYEPLGSALVRMPLLPVDAYPSPESKPSDAAADATARAAIAVSSPDLFRALNDAALSERQAARARAKLHRFMIRMTSRPTPYGLFAGVGLVSWGSTSDLGLTPDLFRTRAHPDMAWLLGLVCELERDIAVRRGLQIVASNACIVRAGRVFVAASAPSLMLTTGTGTSLRATDAVLGVMGLARSPIVFEELIRSMLSRFDMTRDEVEALIAQLLEAGALLSDLRPPLTCSDPTRYVHERLAALPAAAATADALGRVLDELEEWDACPVPERSDAVARISRHMEDLHPVPRSASPLHVDTALALAGRTVHRAVAADVAGAAELMLRLSRWSRGLPHLESYRARFIERYGAEREVPLLELLEPQLGLGPPELAGAEPNGAQPSGRRRWLEAVALRAQRDPGRHVDLDDGMLERLQTWALDAGTAPVSLDLAVFVAARSAAELDRGEFQIVLGPNVGAGAAGRNAGRFAHLLGNDGIALLTQAAEAEAERIRHALWAEIVYAPAEPRTANVAVRPAVRPYEIVIGTRPGVADDHVVPLGELVVGIRDERFYVRWPARDVDLQVTQGHMLNWHHAPPVVSFLLDVAADRGVQLSQFDWGPAAAFPFLPRVSRGRVVLSPAQWRVSGGGGPEGLAPNPVAQFTRNLSAWRTQWRVPRYVYLTVVDNRLLLDLDDTACTELLRDDLARLPDDGSVLLQEALPGLEHAWAQGPNGSHIVELVVPLVLRSRRPAGIEPPAAVSPRPAGGEPSPDARIRPPGSEWLYLKLYCPPVAQDELIAGRLRAFTQITQAASMSDCWFFVRYADPAPHVRVRFHGDPDTLVGTLLPELTRWANDLVLAGLCERFAFDTYERELERYGGGDGTLLAEAIFTVDSVAVAELLHLIGTHPDPPDRLTLAMLSIDDLLASLGFDELARHEHYLDRAILSSEDGREYRQRKVALARLFGSSNGGPPDGLDPEIWRILAARHRDLTSIATELAILEDQGTLPTPRSVLYANYVHMHCNRLGTGPALEQQALQLLRRTRESLRARARA